MKLSELVAEVNDLRPNSYSEDVITSFINEIEQRVVGEVISKATTVTWTPYVYDTDADKTLLVPDQFKEVYTSYVFAKIDYMNAETARYQYDGLLAEAAFKGYASWYRRENRPKGFKWSFHI